MARTSKALAVGTITNASATTIYTASNVNTILRRLVLTNTTATAIPITVSLRDGTTTRALKIRSIPAGNGKTWDVVEIQGQTLNNNYSVILTSGSADTFNYYLSGAEIST